ncbi:MAG: leucine-rich repeat domain-containing protein [bacterium]|nr:leucine-rich repeat domain-containing protein [bacterium]
MKNFKKVILAGAMLLSVGTMSVPTASVSAAKAKCNTNVTSTQSNTSKKFTSGNLCYKVTGNNTCTVTGLSSQGKKSSSCSIPTSVTCNGKKYKVTSIANNAFKNCDNLKSVKVSNCVSNIGANAFKGCDSLKNVTLGKGVSNLGSNAFSSCNSLKSVNCGSTIKTLGSNCFGNSTCRVVR